VSSCEHGWYHESGRLLPVGHMTARPGAIETRDQEKYVLDLQSSGGRRQKRNGNWFERLTGFTETTYDETRSN
jgi:hypothetical protein